MITIFTTNSCASCRKAINWLKEHNIQYKEKNLFVEPVTKDDIKRMLENTENGFEDIISTRSKVIQESKIDIESMTYNSLIDLIIKNPSILRRPIIIDDKKLQVGYNDDDIRVFIPRELRKLVPCGDCASDCEYKKLLEQCLNKEKNSN